MVNNMKIEAAKSSIVKKALLKTLISFFVIIALNILIQGGYTSLSPLGIILILSISCFISVIFYLATVRNSISSIELNESDVIIYKFDNPKQVLSWNDISAMDTIKIATRKKYIRLPGYLFGDADQNKDYQNFIHKKLFEESIKCLKCGNILPESSKVCKNCGWSYQK